MKKGSDWRKWNFHVHTKDTNKNDQFNSPTLDDFFYAFFKGAVANQIAAIGVTDYFSIEMYLKAAEYKNTIEHKVNENNEKIFDENEIDFIRSIFLFPNVELRMMPSTDKGKLINIHCLFNPEYVTDLDNDFFGHLQNQIGFKMNRHGITTYGKSLDPLINDVKKQYQKGIDNFALDVKSIVELSENKRFRDNTLFVVSNSSNDGASGLQQHYNLFENEPGSLDGVRMTIYSISDAIFSNNPKDVKYFLGKRLEGTKEYTDKVYRKEISDLIGRIRSLKACITGCDAHTEADLFKRFTWIKADPSFEGLRQICYEPEQRVKIQNEEPDFKEGKLLIESVRFISPNKIFSEEPIMLNSNLNVIIGGKSSGKSILLYSIAKTLTVDSSLLQNDDGSYRYNLNEVESDFDFEITTKGKFSQKMNRPEGENSIMPEIKYIPQSYLVKLAEPELNKKGRPLNKLVRALITEDSESNELYELFLAKVKQNDKARNSQIDNFFEISKRIATLEEELRMKSNKEVLETNIISNTEKVEELSKSTGLSTEQIQEYKNIQQESEIVNERLQKFRDDLSAATAFSSEIVQILKNIKQKRDTLIDNLQLSEIKEHVRSTYDILDTILDHAILFDASIEVQTRADGRRVFRNDNKFKEIVQLINTKKGELNESIKPYLKDTEAKNIIEQLNESIASDKKALGDIVNLTKRIADQKRQLAESRTEIFRIYDDSFSEYGRIVEGLKPRTAELQKDGLLIEGKPKFNFPKLAISLEQISDGRTASHKNYSILREKKATDELDYSIVLHEVMQIFDDILSEKYVLKNKIPVSDAVKYVLTDHFFDYWEIRYKDDKLGHMSTGKASFVILMLIIGLSKSKAPILIDQPEDNLDNRSITADLVYYLRNKKMERQIIVVTHNANIVVNADAENVIVANQKGQNNESSSSVYKFDYINGAMENSFERISKETDLLKSMGIRQHIADIVEGGREAFIMREQKYRFR